MFRTALAVAASLAATVASSRADVVLDWNDLMLDAIRTDNTGPTLSTRNLAILHVAMFDSVNSIERTHQPYQFLLNPPANASVEAAAVAAAYEVMKVLYPPVRARSDELYDSYVAGQSASPTLDESLAFGAAIGREALEARGSDGSNTDVPYIPSNDPGQWRRTPPFFRPPLTPQWRYVDLFCLPSQDPFLPPPPPALDSVAYAYALNEVKEIGSKNSATRTAEQSLIARFWSDFSYTAMPPGHWHEIAAVIARERGNTLAENARLFALIALAQADSAIVCWEVKFRYNFWRPVTAIQRANEDNNPLTVADPAWEQFLPSPPFPAYMSGHSTFSKATAQVLTHFLGTDAVSFTAASDTLPGVFRSFTSLAVCADEIGMSRIYGGFHFQFDNIGGKSTGKAVGDYVSANFLLPVAGLPLVRVESLAGGSVVLRMHGHIDHNCVTEASPDLTNWTSISTNAAVVGGVLISDTGAAGETVRFYRVREP